MSGKTNSAFDLSGQTALITGGGTGLGFGMAKCFVAAGARVALVGRRQGELDKACAALGANAFALQGDVTTLAGMPALVDSAEKLAGPISILVNNAGVHLKKSALETSDSEFEKVIQTHVFGAFALTREVGKRMVARKSGSILFTASMTALMGVPLVVAYSAAKSAYVGMMRTLSSELGGSGVRVNALAPGWIQSDMLDQALAGDPPRKAKILGRTPLNRFGEPEDVGWAAVYLCSPAAKFVTGVVLPVDGGAAEAFWNAIHLSTEMNKPILRHIANLWTLIEHPWSLDEKLRAFKEAGFDGVCWAGSPELRAGCEKYGLIFVGGMASGKGSDFPRLLQEQKECGAIHVNVQLGTDEMSASEALELALALNREGKRVGVVPGIETHRGTCTETPEKHYALCDAYEKATGELLPLSIDFSHFAVVKHLVPENFAKRLLVRPDLIQRAQQFHLRPFNGHHVQIPVTDGKGNLTREFNEWLPFAEVLLQCWLDGNADKDREIFVCPELGPVAGGYCLSTFHDSWEDKKVLRTEIDKLWRRLTA